MSLVSRWIAGSSLALWLAAASLCWSPPSAAVIGTHDNVPAATLLMPYFEVDLNNTNGQSSALQLTNASATAMLTNVTIWSDRGISLFNFNVYLVGYDTQPIDLREVLAGNLPRTASAGQDPSDSISPKGQLSQDINFASCGAFLPPVTVPAAEVTDLRAGLTGQPMPGQGGLCASTSLGDGVARGYVTVDAVNACSALDPDEAGYTSLMTTQNVLHGEYSLFNPSQNFSGGDTLVAVEGANLASGNYTFYGAYNNATAADRREPLGTRWAMSRISESPTPDTQILVWRDAKRIVSPFNCASGAGALQIQAGTVIDRDALGNQQPTATAGLVAPRSSQSLRVGLGTGTGSLVEVGSKTGWLEFNLNHALASGNLYGNNAQSFPVAAMGSLSGAQGRFRVAIPPVQLQVVTQPPTGAAP